MDVTAPRPGRARGSASCGGHQVGYPFGWDWAEVVYVDSDIHLYRVGLPAAAHEELPMDVPSSICSTDSKVRDASVRMRSWPKCVSAV